MCTQLTIETQISNLCINSTNNMLSNINEMNNNQQLKQFTNNILNDIISETNFDIFNIEQKQAIIDILFYLKNTTNKKYLSLTGNAGAGKSYTILNMFQLFPTFFKDSSVCFAGPTNMIVNKFKELDTEIINKFKNVDFLTINQLLGEKLAYNSNGEKYFKRYKKKIPLYNFDIIIIDESSMIGNDKIKTILEELQNNNSVCIFIGDRNQLNPVNELENKILYDSDINLTINERCGKKILNKIYNYIIAEINLFNKNYKIIHFNKFYNTLKNYLSETHLKNKYINFYNQKQLFLEEYIKNYNKLNNNSLIITYTNKECENINIYIKNKIINENNLSIIDNKYYIGQQILFMSRYITNINIFNTSEIAQIIGLQQTSIKLKKLSMNNLYEINKDNPLNNTYISNYNEKDYILIKKNIIDEYGEIILDDIEELLYIYNELNEININKIKVSIIKNKTKIEDYLNIIKLSDIITYNKFIDKVEKNIFKLKNKYFIKNSKNILLIDYIINGLYLLLNVHFKDIFADISDGFALTCHKAQGCTVDNIYVDLESVKYISNNDIKNKIKWIYTSMTRCSNKLYVYSQ